jgi:hypothetical protein
MFFAPKVRVIKDKETPQQGSFPVRVNETGKRITE